MPDPAPARNRERVEPWVVRLAPLAYLLGAVRVTWPLAGHLTTRIPSGTEATSTVPLFNLWALRWNADRLGHAYAGYWQAPIFHPTRGTFAFSDAQPLTGVVFALLRALTGSPTLGYNLVLVGALMLNGWAAARLCRQLGVGAVVAVLVGLLVQRLPFVTDQLGVLQLVMVWPVLVTLESVIRWARDGGRRPAVTAGLGLAVTFLTCSYYGLFVVAVLAVAGVLLVGRERWSTARLGEGALGIAALSVIAVPVLVAQQHWLAGYRWTSATIRSNSARLGDYLSLDSHSIGARVVPWVADDRGTGQRLYPGTVVLVLAAMGWWWGRRGPHRREVRFLAAGVAIAVVVSLGLNLKIFGVMPYDGLRRFVPGFSRLRSPFRFAVIAQLLLLALAGIGLHRIVRRPQNGWSIALLLVALAAAEVSAGSSGLVVVPPRGAPWSRWLARQPEGGAVAMVPFPAGPSVVQYEPTAEAMLSGLDHHKPLVNGYSGFFPTSYEDLTATMDGFPDGVSVDALRRAGTRWVVVERGWLTAARRSRLTVLGALRQTYAGGGRFVFELR